MPDAYGRDDDDEEDEEELEEAPKTPFIPKPTKGHSLANLKNLEEDKQLRALAIYLSRNGQISNRHLARMVQCHESSVAIWRSEGHWPELARQKLAEQEAMLVSFSAEFCARRLASIHTQDLQRVEELNRQLSLQLAKNIVVDDEGEETLAGKKTKAYELKAIAEALQFNVRTARLILGADIERTPAEKGADQLMSLVQAAWASSAMKTSHETVDIHIQRTYDPGTAVLEDAAAAEAAGPFPFIDVEAHDVGT